MENFAKLCWSYHDALDAWEDGFCDLFTDDEEDYQDVTFDSYNGTLRFSGATNDWRLTTEQQAYLINTGFVICEIVHRDGYHSFYDLEKDKTVRCWRRLTTKAGFEVNYWPDDWTNTEWLETGYVVIVPD